MRAERLDSALQPRVWSLNRVAAVRTRHLLLLLDGAGEADIGHPSADGHRTAVAGPAVIWLGRAAPTRLALEAGAHGHRAWIPEETVVAAIGDMGDSAAIAALAERDFVLSLAGYQAETSALERCLLAALAEQAEPRAAAPLLASALLRIVLVLLLRVSGGTQTPLPASGERLALLQRFRQLVEMNFRSHWTIADYADALSISTDRLHAICRAGIGKSPKALVSERLAHEAATRLERSSLTIEQLGHLLGFGDPAHFSNFFRKMRGMPPGRFRTMMLTQRAGQQQAPSPRFSEWP